MIIIESVNDLEVNLTDFYESPLLSLDTETEGLDPFTDKLRLVQLSNRTKTLVIDLKKANPVGVANLLRPILENPKQIKILQNAKFDLKFIKQQLNIDVEGIFDTMIASQLIEGGIGKEKGYHGLESVAKRYGGRDISKEQQMSDWSGVLSQAQYEYAATDVESLFLIREKEIEVLKELRLIKCAKLEFDAVLPIAWLELCGFYLDYNEWMEEANRNLQLSYAKASEINEVLKPFIDQQALFDMECINLDSHIQIRKYFTMAGVPLPDSTRELKLLPLVEKYPVVGALLDYRGFKKNYTSFGEGFQKFINPKTGRLHANFIQVGPETGRLATSSPNLAQIPSDDPHRNCFKAQEGNSLLGADFSQEELRLIACFAGDKKMIAAFNSDADFHTNTAAMLWNLKLADVTKKQRDLAKRANFGLIYGAGAEKFAVLAGIPVPEAALIRTKYFKTFAGMNRWILFQKQHVLETRCSRTGSGRLIKYEFDETDKFETSSTQRCAVNGPIQGTGADILKRTLRLLYDSVKHYGEKVKLVNIVHDQLDLEVEDSLVEEVGKILEKSMVAAGSEHIREVPVKVDSHVSKVWKK